MYLHLLEFTYAAENRETVEAWLTKADLTGVLISEQQYDDEIFAVLANDQTSLKDHEKLARYPAILSCQAKRRFLYRITTTNAPKSALLSFPLSEGDEWYAGARGVVYLSVQSHKFKQPQISWLAACPEIVAWEPLFALAPIAEEH